MNKIMNMFDKMAPALIKFSQLKYIDILQKSFIETMPVLLIGSIFLLIAAFPVPVIKELVAPLNLATVSTVTTDLFSLFLIIAVTYHTVQYNQEKRGTTYSVAVVVILALSAFILTLKPVYGDIWLGTPDDGELMNAMGSYIPMIYLGTKGILAAMLTSVVTAEIFDFFIRKKIIIKMPEGVPPMVADSFASIIPFFIIMLFWWFLAIFVNLNIPQIFLSLFSPLVMAGDSLPAVLGITFLNRALWMVGIHGSNVISGVTGPLLTTMATANLEAFSNGQDLPYIASTYFYDVYVWIGLAPLSLCLILTKSPRLKSLGYLSLVPALFNIGEPLIFGLPIVLNPLMFIPFVLSYVVLGGLSYLLVHFGLLFEPVLAVTWTLPAPIKAFLSTNYHIWPVIYVLVCWVIMFFIFLPFVKAIERQDIKEAVELDEEKREREAAKLKQLVKDKSKKQ